MSSTRVIHTATRAVVDARGAETGPVTMHTSGHGYDVPARAAPLPTMQIVEESAPPPRLHN